jgi:hypothetical protein
MGIGTFKAVERMPEIVKVMCAGIDFLPNREIDLTGFFVSRSGVDRSLCFDPACVMLDLVQGRSPR